MSRVLKIADWIEAHPDLMVQGILSTVLVITGLYIAGPWYVGGPTTAVGVGLESEIVRIITGLFYLVSGTTNLIGIAKSSVKWRYWGTLAVFLSYVFMALLRLFTFGFTPIFWVVILGMASIASVKHLRESRRLTRGG
jgi:hypothetical protein